jgi:hypothetical protein
VRRQRSEETRPRCPDGGKAFFPTKEEADLTGGLFSTRGYIFKSYKCDRCGGWHLTKGIRQN